MQTERANQRTCDLGEIVAAAYDVSGTVASDRATAAELAARRLERVLARGANARLIAALRGLARELAPTRVRGVTSDGRAMPWALRRLAVAR